MSNLKIVQVFPTPVLVDSIGREFTEDEKVFFAELELWENIYNLSSKNSYVLDEPIMAPLKQYILKKLNDFYLEIYQPNTPGEVYITQSWINVTVPGKSHHMHQHPNSLLSGTLYLSAEEEVDKLVFSKTDYSSLKVFPKVFNQFNSSSWYMPVKTGDLLIFPSTLFHYVDPVSEHDDRPQRISLSFNSFVKGVIGSEGFLCELKL